MSLHALAATLTQQGIPTPRGGAWTATAVRRVLARTEDTRLDKPGEFEVAAGDGKWVGIVMEIQDGQRILAARSFLN